MAKPKERTFFLPSYGTRSETENNNNNNNNNIIMEEEKQGIMLPLNYPGSSASSSTIASTESESSFLIPITGVGACDYSLSNNNNNNNKDQKNNHHY